MLIASFPETQEIGIKVAKELGAKHASIIAKDFPDGEFHLKLKKNPKHEVVVIISSITQDPDEKIIETILAGGIARDYGAKKVILVATYLPYMRQDRHFIKYDSFSSKHILKLFGEFDKVFVIEPHLHRINKLKKLYLKAEEIKVRDLIAKYIEKKIKGDFLIVGPDEESAQWSRSIASLLNKKVVILKKERFSANHVKIKEQKLGKNIIIIDDIISTGKTIAATLKIAKEQGAKKIFCIGIHGLLVNGADKLIKKYAALITTNTIKNKYAKIDISPSIAETLKRYRESR